MIEFRFPKPGEGRAPWIAVAQEEIASLLVSSALSLSTVECPEEPDCPNCNATRRLWWDLCVALDRPLRIRMQAHMRMWGIPLPDGPWDEYITPTGEVRE